MTLMTGQEYIDSIRNMKLRVYMFGEEVADPVDNPIIRPSLNSVRMTYDLAQEPEHEDLMTVIAPETGQRISRFTHIHRDAQDLVKKVKMQRLLGQQTAACFQRCVGPDDLRPLPAEIRGVMQQVAADLGRRSGTPELSMQVSPSRPRRTFNSDEPGPPMRMRKSGVSRMSALRPVAKLVSMAP